MGDAGGGSNESDGARALSLVGQVLAVLVVLLPLIGGVMRFTSFSSITGPRVQLAAAAPIPQLGGYALEALALFVMVGSANGIAYVLGTRSRPKLTKDDNAASGTVPPVTRASSRNLHPVRVWLQHQWKGAPRGIWLYRGVVGLSAVVVLVFGSGFPGTPALVLAAISATPMTLWINRRRVRGPLAYWPVILTFGLAAMFAATSQGRGIGVTQADIEFAETSTLEDGEYLTIGQAEGTTYLVPCGSHDVIALPSDQVLALRYNDAPRRDAGPSLIDALRGEEVTFGVQTDCGD